MGNLFTEEVGKVLTRLLGNYLTEALGKVLDIYIFVFFALTGANLMGYQLYFQDGGIRSIMAFAGALTGLFLSRGISLVGKIKEKRRS